MAKGFPAESCGRVTRGNFRQGKWSGTKTKQIFLDFGEPSAINISKCEIRYLNQCARCKININIGRLAAACDKKVRGGSKGVICTP